MSSLFLPLPSITLTSWHRAALALLESTALHLDPTLPGWAAIDDEAARCGDDPVLATAPTLAGLIEAALPRALAECYVTPAQVALCMIDLKLARLAHDPNYADGPIDVIGYAALIPEIIRGSRS